MYMTYERPPVTRLELTWHSLCVFSLSPRGWLFILRCYCVRGECSRVLITYQKHILFDIERIERFCWIRRWLLGIIVGLGYTNTFYLCLPSNSTKRHNVTYCLLMRHVQTVNLSKVHISLYSAGFQLGWQCTLTPSSGFRKTLTMVCRVNF